MYRTRSVASGLLLASALLAGCDREHLPVSPGGEPRAAATQAPGRPVGIDAEFARLEKEIPGFGGYFYDEDGTLTVYLSDRGQEGTARAKLASRERAAGARGESTMRIRQGRYSFSQLHTWRGRLSEVLAMEGVIYTDLDEAVNRLRIGVASDGAASSVRARVAKLGVPVEAVEVSVTKSIRPLATLRDHVRPVDGGLLISTQDPNVYRGCTLGFNVLYYNRWTYLTNSHCTNVQGGIEGTQHWQPHYGNTTYQLGYELSDPNYFTGGSCPAGRRCRWSDAALGVYNTGVPFNLGYIARTTYRGTTAPGSIDIDPAQPRMQITWERKWAAKGFQYHKIGQATGWTYGLVDQTCVDMNYEPPSTITFLCQDFVKAKAGAGDSGSPVFVWNGSTVELAGVVVGGPGTENPEIFFIMSSLGNIEYEMGDLITY